MSKPKRGAKRARGIPIFAQGIGHPVGYVQDGEFRKSVRGSVHFLRSPRAIAFDTSTLRDAERAGARRVVVQDTETGKVYRADIDTVLAHGFRVERGHNEQTALTMERWSTSGNEHQQGSLFAA